MLLMLGFLRLLQAGCHCHSLRQDDEVKWVAVAKDTFQCHVEVPLDHFHDEGATIKLSVKQVRRGNQGRHLWDPS